MTTTSQKTSDKNLREYIRLGLRGKACTSCGVGKLQELSIYDDWDGKLTCTKCGRRTESHIIKEVK